MTLNKIEGDEFSSKKDLPTLQRLSPEDPSEGGTVF